MTSQFAGVHPGPGPGTHAGGLPPILENPALGKPPGRAQTENTGSCPTGETLLKRPLLVPPRIGLLL